MAKIGFIILLSVVALILFFIGMGFFISSLYLYLVSIFDDSRLASFYCGLALLLLCILLLLIVILIKSRLFKFKSSPKIAAKVEAVKENPSGEALKLVKQYPFQSAFFALGSGFLLGFFPKLRDSLIDGASTYLSTGSLAESLKSLKSKEDESD